MWKIEKKNVWTELVDKKESNKCKCTFLKQYISQAVLEKKKKGRMWCACSESREHGHWYIRIILWIDDWQHKGLKLDSAYNL